VGYSPVTGGVLIYAGDLTGTLYAFNPNGSVAWTISLLNNGGSVSASAVAADGTVYATSGYLYAVTPSGKLKWTFTPTGGLIPFSPAIGSDGTIYFGDQCGIFYALNPDGTMKWKFTKFEVAACPDAGENPIGTPALASNGTIYVWAEGTGINNGFVFALDPSGNLLWANSSVSGSPSVGPNGTVYIDSAKQLYALNPSGVLQWTLTAPADAYFSLPAIANNNTIYLGTNTAGFYAVNPSGTIKWNSTPGGATLFWGPPSIGADGTIYDGGASPDVTGLFAINPDGTLKWAQPMCTATFVNEPAIGADGTIYVIPDFGPGACGSLYAFH
jgi:outer membrane protein assembly factor BamB